MINFILKILLGFIVGFGIWYLIFFFLTVEPNPLNWHWATKIIYLVLALSSVQGSVNGLTDEK